MNEVEAPAADATGGTRQENSIHVPLHHRSLWSLVKPGHVQFLRIMFFGFVACLVGETIACPFALLVEPSTDVGFCGGSELKWFVALFTLVGCMLLAALPYWYTKTARPYVQEAMFDATGEAGQRTRSLAQDHRRRDTTVFIGVALVISLSIGLYGFRAAWPHDSGNNWTPPLVPKKPCGGILAAARFTSVMSVATTLLTSMTYVMYFNYLQWRRNYPDRDGARAIEF